TTLLALDQTTRRQRLSRCSDGGECAQARLREDRVLMLAEHVLELLCAPDDIVVTRELGCITGALAELAQPVQRVVLGIRRQGVDSVAELLHLTPRERRERNV